MNALLEAGFVAADARLPRPTFAIGEISEAAMPLQGIGGTTDSQSMSSAIGSDIGLLASAR